MSMVELKVTKKKFVDLDFSFARHPITNDVSKKVNEAAISTAVKNLVMTRRYDRPFHPEISSQVHDMLFEPLTDTTAETLKRTIYYVITNFEPRVEVLLINVEDVTDFSEIKVTIVFKIIGSVNTIKTQFFLQRSL
jgi:phage baseplate assembly protein W